MVLLIHTSSTVFLAGLIWFVQIVHYPLFSRVGTESFPAYHRDHSRLTTWIVLPAMVVELGTAIYLLGKSTPADRPLFGFGLALIGLIWGSTFLLQVPRHRELAAGFRKAAHRRLVRTNWIRTGAWTLRMLLVLFLLQRG